MNEARPWGSRIAVWVILACAIAACYSSAVPGDFVYDDAAAVRDNPRLRSLGQWSSLWTGEYWGGESRHRHYRPVTLTTFLLDRALWGQEAAGFHRTNLLLHLAASLALWELLSAWFGRSVLTGLGALLFALHPLHTEAVTSIVGRAEVLAGGFVFLYLLAHRRALRAGSARGVVAWSALAGGCLLLGLLSKESALVGPGLLWWSDRMAPVPGTTRRTWGAVALGAAILALFFLLRWAAIGTLGTGAQVYRDLGFGADVRLPRALAVLGEYLRLCVVPWPLVGEAAVNDNPAAVPIPWTSPEVALSIGTLVLLGVLAVRGLRDPGPASLGAGWFLLAVVPIANVFVEIGVAYAERLVYLASAGPLLLLAVAAARLWPADEMAPGRRRAATAVLALGLGLAGLLTWDRNHDWASDESFYLDIMRKEPTCTIGYLGTARLLQEAGRIDEADDMARRAAAVAPGNPQVWMRLGAIAMSRSDWQGADEAFARVERAAGQELVGRHAAALGRMARGTAQASRGEDAREAWREAIDEFSAAVERWPENVDLWVDYALACSLAEPPDPARADAAFERALTLAPGHPRALFNRGWLALQSGRPGEAIRWLEELVGANPGYIDGWRLLEEALRDHGAPAELEDCRRRMRALGIDGRR